MLKRFAEGRDSKDHILHLRMQKQTSAEQERQGVRDILDDRHRRKPSIKIEDSDSNDEVFPHPEREKIKMEEHTE